ncbi:hypothetical protein Glove_319g21 [Diversispora epigaea]|uniref:Zinc-ribbon domain-containing protein n=1 Tax=Diversispora epigaea TaxID=1348612 RepID=A0A397HQC1_9GLOM|nr:hypothetical protein Glove_319g21 [Diversispora epigaea]
MPFQIKYSIYDAYKIAESRNGQCLSDHYINCNTPLRWKCAKGHEWTANFHSIKNCKTWCSTCSDTRLDISVAKELAHSKNGHEWTANFTRIKNQGAWCPDCAHRRPLTLEIAKKIAFSRNGECLSTEYINSNVPMQWQCIMGYKWNATLSNIKRDQWCPHCAGVISHTLEIAKQIAYSRNGKCLSTEYKNLETDLLWSCAKGHEWYASFSGIKNKGGTWCPYCAGNVRYTLEKCTNGHLWNAPLFNIKVLGTWCSFCRNKCENLCREIVTKYLGPPSNIRQPDFLKTYDHPLRLELDIYYPEFGLTIEVQGQQHKKYIEFFHRGDPSNFFKQQIRDQLKKKLCEENWIVLKVVWYYEDPYIVIREHLRELGLIE